MAENEEPTEEELAETYTIELSYSMDEWAMLSSIISLAEDISVNQVRVTGEPMPDSVARIHVAGAKFLDDIRAAFWKED